MTLRILFLSSHLPLPGISGGRQREYEILSRLSRKGDVDGIIVTNTYEADTERSPRATHLFDAMDLFPSPEPKERTANTQRDHRPYQIRRNFSREAQALVARRCEAERYDLIHAEGYYMVPLIPTKSPPLVLVEQNIEYHLDRQRTFLSRPKSHAPDAAANPFTERVKIHEIAAWRRADRIGFLTEEDRARADRACPGLPSALTPNGKPPFIQRDPDATAPQLDLLMTANFAYQPSVDGALWFLDQILPRLRTGPTQLDITFAGSGPTEDLRAQAEAAHVRVTGPVESLTQWFHNSKIAICPLRIGGGVKMKMLDALAHGMPIVATSVAAEGFSNSTDSFFLADDPAAFAHALDRLLADPNLRASLARKAAATWLRLPDWDDATESLMLQYRRAIGAEAGDHTT